MKQWAYITGPQIARYARWDAPPLRGSARPLLQR